MGMLATCYHVRDMSKMIQVRDVPDDLHRRLKVRAAQEGISLSDYLKHELARIADTPTLDEMLERIRQREPVELKNRLKTLSGRIARVIDRPGRIGGCLPALRQAPSSTPIGSEDDCTARHCTPHISSISR